MTDTLYETRNGYLLCAVHLDSWHQNGNDVDAWPMTAAGMDLRYEDYKCADCKETI